MPGTTFNPLKRPAAPMLPGSPAKRMNLMATGQQTSYAGAVNPASLDELGRLCRICGKPNPIIFRLKDKVGLLERVRSVLDLQIDFESDEKLSYPGVVCKRCCSIVESLYNFKKSV